MWAIQTPFDHLFCDNLQVLCSGVMWIQDKIADISGGLAPGYTKNGVSQNPPSCKTENHQHGVTALIWGQS